MITNQVLLFLSFVSSCSGLFNSMWWVAIVRSVLIFCSIKLMVVCNCVVCFYLWFKGVVFRSCKFGYWWLVSLYIEGRVVITFSHIPFALIVFAPFCRLMGANSFTKSLSPTNSENGDNDNIHQISPASNFAKSAHSNSMGRGGSDYPCHPVDKGQNLYAKATKFGVGRAAHTSDPVSKPRDHPPLPPSITLPSNVIGNSNSLDLCADKPLCLLGKVWGEFVPLLAIINKNKHDWKFIRGQVSYIDLGNNWISIKFANTEDKEMVWRERPWHVNGLNLVLSPWLPFFDPYSTCIDRVDQWVRVPRFPWEF